MRPASLAAASTAQACSTFTWSTRPERLREESIQSPAAGESITPQPVTSWWASQVSTRCAVGQSSRANRSSSVAATWSASATTNQAPASVAPASPQSAYPEAGQKASTTRPVGAARVARVRSVARAVARR